MNEHQALFSLHRGATRRWLVGGCILALLLTTLLPQTAAAAPVRRPAAVEHHPAPPVIQVIRELNRQRRLAGLQPLRVNPRLMTTAQSFSLVQAKMGELNHRGLDYSNAGQRLDRIGYNWTYWGETIAGGFLADEVVAAWLASPSHRRILFSPKATEIGAGHVAITRDPAKYYDYWVINVGRQMPTRTRK